MPPCLYFQFKILYFDNSFKDFQIYITVDRNVHVNKKAYSGFMVFDWFACSFCMYCKSPENCYRSSLCHRVWVMFISISWSFHPIKAAYLSVQILAHVDFYIRWMLMPWNLIQNCQIFLNIHQIICIYIQQGFSAYLLDNFK